MLNKQNQILLGILKCLLFPNSSVIINLKSDLEFKEARDLLTRVLFDFNIWKFVTKLSQNIYIDYNIKSYDIIVAENGVEIIETQFKNGSKIKLVNDLNKISNNLNL